MSEISKKGEATRRRVLGDAHVDRSRADPGAWEKPFIDQITDTAWETPFIDQITDTAWGHTWSRDTLSLRERSMITLALLAGLGNFEEFGLHLRATANTGATKEDVMDVLLHVSVYAGVPRANHAVKLAKEVFAEMEGQK